MRFREVLGAILANFQVYRTQPEPPSSSEGCGPRRRTVAPSPQLETSCGKAPASPRLQRFTASRLIHRKSLLVAVNEPVHRNWIFSPQDKLVCRNKGDSPQVPAPCRNSLRSPQLQRFTATSTLRRNIGRFTATGLLHHPFSACRLRRRARSRSGSGRPSKTGRLRSRPLARRLRVSRNWCSARERSPRRRRPSASRTRT
jgi:hypothetical protein